jgi:hypothetical protein
MHTMPDAILSMNNDEYPISYLLIGSSILFLFVLVFMYLEHWL